MMPDTTNTMGTESRASTRVVAASAMPVGGTQDPAAEEDRPCDAVGALPGLRAGGDARQAQPQGRMAYADARGQARGEEVEAARDKRQGDEDKKGR